MRRQSTRQDASNLERRRCYTTNFSRLFLLLLRYIYLSAWQHREHARLCVCVICDTQTLIIYLFRFWTCGHMIVEEMQEVHVSYKMCDAFYCALHKKKCGKDALRILLYWKSTTFCGKNCEINWLFYILLGFVMVIFATRLFYRLTPLIFKAKRKCLLKNNKSEFNIKKNSQRFTNTPTAIKISVQ